ncbi:insD protein [Escherichia coli]|nr:insD protein [Escherichia coli]APJ94131.1 insD protein [Escherichia coli]
MKTSGNKLNKRRCRCDEAANAEVLARILDIISDMPTYGCRRV